jgi:hypothetical protein
MKRVISLLLLACLAGSCATRSPSLVAELQAQAAQKGIPAHLTDLGILLYGEKILNSWGLRSEKTEAFDIGGNIALAALSTGALAASGGGVSADTTRGFVGAFNFLLQVMGIIKPAERNDARNEGAEAIIEARGAFLEALAAKNMSHVSSTRFTPQGALYFKQIGAAIILVNKLIVGLRPRMRDLSTLEPVPPNQQPNPGPEPR